MEQGGFANGVHFKEKYLPRKELAGRSYEESRVLCTDIHHPNMMILSKNTHHPNMMMLYTDTSPYTGLHSEQVALLDFIVCASGERFVGFGASTFSFFMREYRLMHGKPRSTSVLVDASAILTDPLFYSAGLIVPFP